MKWPHRLSVAVVIGMIFLASVIAGRSTLEPSSPIASASHSETSGITRSGLGVTNATASIAITTASSYVSVSAENAIRSLQFPTIQIVGNSSNGYMSWLYFRGTETATNNEFNFQFLQNFTCSIHYGAFYVVAINEDGDEYLSAVYPLNVTARGIMKVAVDFEFPEFIGWEANMWVYLLIQNPGASGCSNVGLLQFGQATLILNGFYSTIRPNGTLSR